ncbi:MAG: AAA family ATPase [Bacteroidota bacterium]
MADPSPTPEDIIGGGILTKKGLLTISGKQKVGKSFLVMNLAMALIDGRQFACFDIRQRSKVLIFSAEGGYYSNRDRIRRIARDVDPQLMDNLHFCFDTRIKIDDDQDYEKIKGYISKYKPDVVIIDPLVKFHSSDENSAQGMSQVMSRIRSIIEDHSISVILTHHDGKGEHSGLRGSSTIAGEYDSYMQLHNAAEGHRIEFELRHNLSPADTHVIFDKETLWFRNDAIDPIVEIVLQYSPIAKKDIVKILKENMNIPPATAYRRIDDAVKNGIIRLEGERYMPGNTYTFPAAKS